jgi:hypothetical protein
VRERNRHESTRKKKNIVTAVIASRKTSEI